VFFVRLELGFLKIYFIFLIYVVVPEEIRVRSRARPSEICCGQSDNGRGFSPSSWVLPCQYHSVSAAYSSRAALMRRICGRRFRKPLDQCFSTAGLRPGTGPWHQLYRPARGSPGICHFSFLSVFHE